MLDLRPKAKVNVGSTAPHQKCLTVGRVRLSRSTHAGLWQNITLAPGIKEVFLVLALFGTASMWMAVLRQPRFRGDAR
jgi:hypothetical protein